ncbi:MAG: 30S ribosomal protein S5 [bacterium]|nr:30S ribosomal protein S5 [bacterium]
METPKTTTEKKSARPSGKRPGGNRPGGRKREQREFEQKILDLARVTRVTGGGKRMRFRATLVIGDKKGRVGIGTSKGTDVAMAIEKAYKQAKKNVITVTMDNETIPHRVDLKYGAAIVLLKPAPKGTGLKSGGAVRVVLEMAGVPNAVSKIMGSKNKINIARATIAGLKELRSKKNA